MLSSSPSTRGWPQLCPSLASQCPAPTLGVARCRGEARAASLGSRAPCQRGMRGLYWFALGRSSLGHAAPCLTRQMSAGWWEENWSWSWGKKSGEEGKQKHGGGTKRAVRSWIYFIPGFLISPKQQPNSSLTAASA